MHRFTALLAIISLTLAAVGCNVKHASNDSAGSESYDKMNHAASGSNGGPQTGEPGGEMGTTKP